MEYKTVTARRLHGQSTVVKHVDLNKYSIKPSKDKLRAVVYVKEKENIYKTIQSYKDQCGFEYMNNLLKRGLISGNALADDGKHSGSSVGMPQDSAEVFDFANEKIATGQQIVAQLNLTKADVESGNLNEIVAQKLAAIYKKDEVKPNEEK